MASRIARIFSNIFGRFRMNTEDETTHQANIHNLPPEILSMIFEHSDDNAIAQNRTVCAYWRDIIESQYTIQLEMTNDNWEAFVKLTKASYIHLRLTDVQFPIYSAPEFNNFLSRVNILEITGFVPVYNVVNILTACRKMQSLTVHHVSIGQNHQGLRNTSENKDDLVFDLTKLNVGLPDDEDDLLDVIYYAAYLLKFDCLDELNLCSLFQVGNVLQLIFAGIFEPLPDEDLTNDVIEMIRDNQPSLELVSFNFEHDDDEKPQMFIKFHPLADEPESRSTTNPTNQHRQILESCLFNFEDYEQSHQCTEMILQIFETQSKMKNLVICYRNDVDLVRIENIIENNCETLEGITIESLEPVEQPFRLLSCSCFRTCLALKELTLCSPNENRKVKLLEFLLLPTSLNKLSLTGFTVTGSWESLGGVTEPSQYLNITEVELDACPWFILDGSNETIFSNMHFRWLLNLFPKIRKLTLTGIRLDRVMSSWDARNLGMPNVPDSISPEFVTWCGQGGGHNARIDSIETSHYDSAYPHLLQPCTVHEIVIRKDPN